MWCTGSVVVAHGLICPAACGILVPRPGIEPASSALEGGFLAAGPLGKSQICYFCFHIFCSSFTKSVQIWVVMFFLMNWSFKYHEMKLFISSNTFYLDINITTPAFLVFAFFIFLYPFTFNLCLYISSIYLVSSV